MLQSSPRLIPPLALLSARSTSLTSHIAKSAPNTMTCYEREIEKPCALKTLGTLAGIPFASARQMASHITFLHLLALPWLSKALRRTIGTATNRCSISIQASQTTHFSNSAISLSVRWSHDSLLTSSKLERLSSSFMVRLTIFFGVMSCGMTPNPALQRDAPPASRLRAPELARSAIRGLQRWKSFSV